MSRARDRADGVLHNRTHEDTDGGRESLITFKGEQSGGEISTLAQIQASHDGTSDDEKADLIFKTNDGSDGASPTEAMRIDSGQNVLIGKSDAETTISGGTPAFQLTGAGVDSSLAVTRREANQYGPTLFLSKSRNTTSNNYTIVQNNDSLGTIAFIGDDGTNLDTYGATISAEVNGTAGANDLPTRLKFSVTHDGAATPTEKIRIDEDGLKFNGDTAAANAFHDYEEGIHTPILYGYTTGSGTVLPLSGNHNRLSYTKIGRQVTVTGKIETSGSHSASGYLIVSMPFVVADLEKVSGTGAGNVFFYRTGDGLHTNATAIPNESNSYVLFYQNTSGGDVSTINAQDMDSAIEFFITVTYFTT